MRTEFYDVNGAKTALLIHGYGSNISHAWKNTIRVLNKNGVNAIAVELSGHGRSSRYERYSFHRWIDEIKAIIHDLSVMPDYVIAHSLGGLLTAGLVSKFHFEKIVLLDPFLYVRSNFIHWFTRKFMSFYSYSSYKAVRKANPSWSREMVIDEVKSIRQWDTKTLRALDNTTGKEIVGAFLANNKSDTLIMKPKRSLLVPDGFLKKVANDNLTVEIIKDAKHSLHKDNEKDYLEKLKLFLGLL